MRRRLIIVGFVALVSFPSLSLTADALPAIPQGGQLVLFGDSITAYGDQQNGWVQRLRANLANNLGRPDVRVVNAGQGGNTVQDLHRRFFWRTWRRPDVVVLCIGINDARFAANLGYSDLDLQEYHEGLQALVKKLQGAGAQVVVASPIVAGEQRRGLNALDPIVDSYARTAEEVAEDHGAPYLDLRSLFFNRLLAENPTSKNFGVLTDDGIHLNTAGNALMAEAVQAKLRKLAPSKTDR